MPSAIRVVTRLQDQDDVAVPSGAGDNNKSYVWNNSTSSFDLVDHLTQAEGDALYLALAGGTMTGAINLGGTSTTSSDADTVHTLGRGAFGYNGSASDQVCVAHRDHMSITGFALRQSSLGATVLNAPSGQLLYFGINNANYMTLSTTTLAVQGLQIATNDGDTVHTLGRAAVGYDGSSSDVAIIAHRDQASATGFALSQSSTGATILNAPTGQTLTLAINDSALATISGTELDLTTLEITSSDADRTILLARSALGYMAVGLEDYAGFAHRDIASGTGYALLQNTAGATYLNSPTGQVISLCINNSVVSALSATALDTKALSITSDDADTVYTLGRSKLGYDGTNSDVAVFAHRDFATSTNSAIRQNASGATSINTASGQVLSLAVNGSAIATMSSTTLALGALATTSDDSDIVFTYGRTTLGYDGTNADRAIFAHRDFATSTNSAIRQNASGATTVNSVTGQVVTLAVNGTAAATVSSTTLALGALATTSNDASTKHIFGKAQIGEMSGALPTFAGFAHRTIAGTTGYAVLQGATGTTYLNAPTGQVINLCINNSILGTFTATGLGVGNQTPSKKLHIRDATVSGATYGTNMQAVFEGNGDSGIQIVSNAANYGTVMFGDGAASNSGMIRYDHTNDRFIFTCNGNSLVVIDENYLEPSSHNVMGFGRSGVEWVDIWAVDTSINSSSDLTLKKSVSETPLGLDFINKLKPSRWIWKDGGKRYHHGLIAQDVEQTLESLGISTDEFAGYIRDKDTGKRHLRYGEFTAPIIKAIQELQDRISKLEAQNGV